MIRFLVYGKGGEPWYCTRADSFEEALSNGPQVKNDGVWAIALDLEYTCAVPKEIILRQPLFKYGNTMWSR